MGEIGIVCILHKSSLRSFLWDSCDTFDKLRCYGEMAGNFASCLKSRFIVGEGKSVVSLVGKTQRNSNFLIFAVKEQ